MTTKTKREFTAPDWTYFVFTANNPSYGFSGYDDHNGALGNPGASVSIAYQTDNNGKPIPYIFSFGRTRDRVLRVATGKTDVNGTSVVEYLRNHPECAGSENGSYDPETGKQSGIMFKELNEEADAKKAMDNKAYRLKAENIANSLELEDVIALNALLGNYKTGELMNRHALLEVAGNFPKQFMEAYENPQRKAISVIRLGVNANVLKKQGNMIMWNETTVGLDEYDAATKLQKDSQMLAAIEQAIKKVK